MILPLTVMIHSSMVSYFLEHTTTLKILPMSVEAVSCVVLNVSSFNRLVRESTKRFLVEQKLCGL